MRSSFLFLLTSLPLLITLSESSARADDRVRNTKGIHLGGVAVGDRLETRAKSVVAAHAKVAPSSLVMSGLDRFGDGETIVRYAQSHRGIPVVGRGASVRLSRSGQPIATVLDLESELPDRVDAVVTPFDAAGIASSRTAIGATSADAHLVVWPTIDRGARLAWAVLPPVPAGIPMLPRVIVDAETREVLEVRDMIVFAKANVFASNPKKSPSVGSFDLPISPDATNLTNPFIQSSNCIDNKTVKPVNFSGFDLNVHVCDLVQTATPDSNGDYVYAPSDVAGSNEARSDKFSEVSMYFHASKAYAFFRTLQGAPDAQVVEDKPLRVIANLQIPQGITTGDLAKAESPDLALQPFQNAFFAPAAGGLGALFQQLYGFTAGALWFGQGPQRDYSYDGDVVYHELTHAVVDATLKLGAWHVDARGAIDSPGAMNEGLADYFSSAITGDPEVGEYAAADMGVTDGSPIRSLENKDSCSGLVGEVHADSTVFSGALWSARTTLPEADRAKFDAVLYKAMRSNPDSSDLGYEDLAKLFITTLTTDFPQGATALEAKMTERGLLPACERIEAYTGSPRVSHDARIGFAAPGKRSVSVKGIAPGIFQLEAKVPENTASVTVSFTVRAQASGGNPLGGSSKPFSPLVLAKLGAPITWTAKTGHDATIKIDAEEASGRASAVIELPEGTPAGSMFLQIANTGDDDGSYDKVALEFTPRAVAPTDETPPATTNVPQAAADDGCSVTTRGSGTSAGMLLVAAALTTLRRRRRSA